MASSKLSQTEKLTSEESTRPFLYKMAEAKPELAYAACTTLGHFYSPIPISTSTTLTTLYQPLFTMPAAGFMGIAVGWNYSDAIDAFIAADELLSEDTYHKKRNLVKAALNIVSGTQMLVFSYGLTDFGCAALAGATALASPAFAFAMLCDLMNLSIDLYYAAKKAEFEGWLEERLSKLRYFEKRLKEENNLQKRAEILAKKTDLEEDIAARCRVYYAEGYEGCKHKTPEKRKEVIEKIFERDGQIHLEQRLFDPPTETDKTKNTIIQQKCDNKLHEAQTNWAVKFVSFTGMTLLAVASFVACPPLVIIGTVLVTAVSIYYAQKHFRKLIEPENTQVSVAKSGMFSPKRILPFKNHLFSSPAAPRQ